MAILGDFLSGKLRAPKLIREIVERRQKNVNNR